MSKMKTFPPIPPEEPYVATPADHLIQLQEFTENELVEVQRQLERLNHRKVVLSNVLSDTKKLLKIEMEKPENL